MDTSGGFISRLIENTIEEQARDSLPLPVHIPANSHAHSNGDSALALSSNPDNFQDTTLPPQDSQAVTRSGRPCRNYRLPKRFRDIVPQPAAVPPYLNVSAPDKVCRVKRVILIVHDNFITETNSFGIWRDYTDRPTYDPDATLSLEDLAARPQSNPRIIPQIQETPDETRSAYWPFSNITVYRVMQWLNNGSTTKSESQMNEFIRTVIMPHEFSQDHLISFDAHRENQRLDHALSRSSNSHFEECSVEILVPSGEKKVPGKMFQVQGLFYRNLTSVISDAFSGSLAHHYHLYPFKLYHISPITNEEERIYGEIYTSDAFHKEHAKIQRRGHLPPEDQGCKRERVVAALMFSSDATHLTDFGHAKAWPIYVMFGNLSKYIRARQTSGAIHHLAYIPSVCRFPQYSEICGTDLSS